MAGGTWRTCEEGERKREMGGAEEKGRQRRQCRVSPRPLCPTDTFQWLCPLR